ncbi:MAG: hypothetical protein NC483_00725 [Ruminococcus sp.]|nr:hypothetical protein [Ruminococcus sp.]
MYLENTKIIEIENNLSNEDRRFNLNNLYNVINEIGEELYNKGEVVSKCFLTKEQYQEIKKNPENLL